MAQSIPQISPLPANVRAQVSSSLDITSQEQVVAGLVENALDAGAQSIVIQLDLAKGYFVVQDNGVGIKETEFSDSGCLGKAHCTSKLDSPGPTYGRYGRFLSSLSVLALVSITSRHESEIQTSRLVFHRGQTVLRQFQLDENELSIAQSGTKIEVHNLFGDIPVRSRHIYDRFSSPTEVRRAFDTLRRTLIGYLLANAGQIDLRCTVKNSNQKLVYHRFSVANRRSRFTLEMVTSILSQANILSRPDLASWKLASVRTSKFFIRAAISLKPAPSRAVQFIAMGNIPVPVRESDNWLFKLINDQFESSSFGQMCNPAQGDDAVEWPERMTRKQAFAGMPKCIDRWPMFYIRIDGMSAQDSRYLWRENISHEFKEDIESLNQALQSLISHFLVAHGFEHRSNNKGTCTPVRIKSPSQAGTDLCNGTMERLQHKYFEKPGQLNQWHRVKSGRHSNLEDIDYGLPFSKTVKNFETQSDLASELQLLFDNLSSDEMDLDVPSHSTAPSVVGQLQTTRIDTAEPPAGEGALVWTNPCNGQAIRIHPQTGATLLTEESLISFIDERLESQALSPALQQRTPVHQVLKSGVSKLIRPNAMRPFNLESYGQARSFHRCESPIPAIVPYDSHVLDGNSTRCGPGDGKTRENRHVTKEILSQARVLGQVDRKFVLVAVPGADQDLLALIDQHAADERVKLEQLCWDLYSDNSTTLVKPLVFEVNKREASLFKQSQGYFQRWHFKYSVTEESMQTRAIPQMQETSQQYTMRIDSLPRLIAERCRAEPKLLIDLLRQEIWSERFSRKIERSTLPEISSSKQSWLWIAFHCPIGVLKMLKSRSCRTAIMFNDLLDQGQCEELVRRLADCDFPFQCAHGRPTLTVLTEVGVLGDNSGIKKKNIVDGGYASGQLDAEGLGQQDTLGFRRAWDAWE